ncbi:MAG: M56 family metallopeptidase, partial [Candidatus Alkaliphilus sp. MAG34]
MLEKIFLQILNMSFTAGFVIILVLVARLFLKKAPKILSYALWGVILFRLIGPVSCESIFSLLPIKSSPIPRGIVYEAIQTVDTGIPAINHTVNQSLPAATPASSINPLQIWTFIGYTVWLLGMAILLIYSIVSLVRLHGRLKDAVHEKDN